jgi:hypothetical protein
MSKEEILEQCCDSLPAWTGNRKNKVLQAMDEYSNEQYNKAIEDAVDVVEKQYEEMDWHPGIEGIIEKIKSLKK